MISSILLYIMFIHPGQKVGCVGGVDRVVLALMLIPTRSKQNHSKHFFIRTAPNPTRPLHTQNQTKPGQMSSNIHEGPAGQLTLTCTICPTCLLLRWKLLLRHLLLSMKLLYRGWQRGGGGGATTVEGVVLHGQNWTSRPVQLRSIRKVKSDFSEVSKIRKTIEERQQKRRRRDWGAGCSSWTV